MALGGASGAATGRYTAGYVSPANTVTLAGRTNLGNVSGRTHIADGSDPADAVPLEVDVLGYKVEAYTPE